MKLPRGAVVTASIGDPSGKPRPFLVIRSDVFANHMLVTVLAFTSTITDTPSLRVLVEPTADNGLDRPSQAMIDHIQSIRLERIGEVIGQLAKAQLQEITHAVAIYLGLADSPGAARRGHAKRATHVLAKRPAGPSGVTRKTGAKRAVRRH